MSINFQSDFEFSLENSFSNFSKDSRDIELIDIESLNQEVDTQKNQNSLIMTQEESQSILKDYQENQFLQQSQNSSQKEITTKTKKSSKKKSIKKSIQNKEEKKIKLSKKKSTYSACNNSPGFFIGTSKLIFKNWGQLNNDDHLILQWNNSDRLPFKLAENVQIQTLRSTLDKMKREIQKVSSKKGKKSQLQKFLNEENQEFVSISELKMIFAKDQIKMERYVRLAKEILRIELIYVLSLENWIQNHSKQRQFKSNKDDLQGISRIEKEKNYSEYLHYIRDSLQYNKGLQNRSLMRNPLNSKKSSFRQNFQN